MKCPRRFCGAFLNFRTVDGVVVDHCDRCARLYAGICRDCPSPVEGCVGKAIRCHGCKKRRQRENERIWMADPDNRQRKNRAAQKRWRKSKAMRERKKKNSRAWRKLYPDRVKRSKRLYLLKQTAGYVEAQRRWNRDPIRVAKKRAWAIAKYYELHPVRPDPHCSGCGVPIEWTPGHGRPRLTCDSCCTPAELRRRQRGDNKARRAA